MRSLMTVFTIAALLLQQTPVRAQGSGQEHLYAVLINGGRNKLTNHERYWNDCSFLYRTLSQTYRVPKRNITVLMSDGGDPEEDMLKADARGFASSSVDLDGDGWDDVDYPATEQALAFVFLTLSKQLTTDDHLFVFIVDHGGSKDRENDSYIWLWNDQQLSDKHLSLLLNQFDIGSFNILMGQCYSRGFMDDLTREGRIMTTACSGSEQSWTNPDKPYDEFVYHWTCAINGADETGQPVDADTNGDGEVSMAEAFEYARSHDRVNETPQYVSLPEELGEKWTFRRPFNIPTGPLGIRSFIEDPIETWSLSGVRQNPTSHGVYIQRQGNKTRKVIR